MSAPSRDRLSIHIPTEHTPLHARSYPLSSPMRLLSPRDIRTVGAIRAAAVHGDVAAMRQEFQKEQMRDNVGDYIKCIVFGGIDGILNSFALVAAAAGSHHSAAVILVFGISNKIADGFAMGFGEFVSSMAQRDFAAAERKREEREVEMHSGKERDQMIELYCRKGLDLPLAIEAVDIITSCPKLFVDIRMAEEIGMTVSTRGWRDALNNGLVMFFSFVIMGFIPLIAYLPQQEGIKYFMVTILLTGVALLLLGAIKGKLAGTKILSSALLMLVNGAIVAALAYWMAWVVSENVRVP